MAKFLLFAVLLVFIYQWDEIARAVHYAVARLRRRQYRELVLHTDRYVGTVMAIVSMPLVLNYLVLREGELGVGLGIVLAVLLAFWVFASGMGVFLRRLENMPRYEGVTAVAGVVFALSGFFQPVMRAMPWQAGRDRQVMAKLALYLALPVALGLVFRNLYEPGLYRTEFFRYLDALIVVMVGGMFMHVAIGSFRKFSRRRVPILAYFRIVLGLAAAFMVIARLV